VARFWRRVGGLIERAGRHMPLFAAGGVLMVEATKQVAAPTRSGLRVTSRAPIPILDGLPAPAPAGRSAAGT
jgi:hypothetical protein